MFNSNDILSRLQAGETSAQIATEMATALNEAIAMRDAAEKAAQTASQERENKLNEIAARIIDDMIQYITTFDPLIGNLFEEDPLEVASIRKTLDHLISGLGNAARLIESLDELSNDPNQKPKSISNNIDPIREFLRKNGLL